MAVAVAVPVGLVVGEAAVVPVAVAVGEVSIDSVGVSVVVSAPFLEKPRK